MPAPNDDEFVTDAVPFQPRFLLQELIFAHCPYLLQPCLTMNLLCRVDWFSVKAIAGCECAILPILELGRALLGAPDPAGTGGSKRTPMEPLRKPARQFSAGPNEQRTRRRRRTVLAAFLTTRTYLCPLSTSASLIHPRKISEQGGLALSQRSRRRECSER